MLNMDMNSDLQKQDASASRKLGVISAWIFGAASLAFCSCAPLPHTVPFNEAAFAPYSHSGSASVSGTAFTILRDKSQITANQNAVLRIMPANEYTDEITAKRYDRDRKLEPADPRFLRYVRKIHPDENGNFAFHNLPAGNYYVSCHLKWETEGTFVDSDGTIWPTTEDIDQWVYQKISLKSGQSAHIDSWIQGG